MKEEKEISHLAAVRPDKTLLTREVREMFFTLQDREGHEHESKNIIYFPKEIFREEMINELVYFVPTITAPIEEKGGSFLNKVPLPIFMIEFTTEQKKELISCARKEKFHLSEKYFKKPKIAISYEEREAYVYDENFSEENDDY